MMVRDEFERNGMSHLVTVVHRDVCGKKEADSGGFGDDLKGKADAVGSTFLSYKWLAG